MLVRKHIAYIIVAFLFGSIMTLPLSIQLVRGWTGENNTISPGYVEGFTGGNYSNIYVDDIFRLGDNYTAWIESLTSNPFDQDLNTTDSPTFNELTLTSDLDAQGISSPWIDLNGDNITSWPAEGGNPFDQSLNTTDSPTFDDLTLTGNATSEGVSTPWLELNGENRTSWPSGNSSVNRLKGITPTQDVWDTPPSNLAYTTDEDMNTETGEGIQTLSTNGEVGNLYFDMGAVYRVLVVADVNMHRVSGAGSLVCQIQLSTDGSNYYGTQQNEIGGDTVDTYRPITVVYAYTRYIKVRINVPTGVTDPSVFHAKFKEISAFEVPLGSETSGSGNFSGFLDTTELADHGFSGLYINGTAGENLAIGEVAYLKSDGKYWKADCNSSATMPAVVMALEAINADSVGDLLVDGYFRDDTWSGWTKGGLLYVSGTAGDIMQAVPSTTDDQAQLIGYAIESKIIRFDPSLILIEVG